MTASTCQQNVLGNETANRAKDSSLKGACLTGRKSHGLNRVEGIWKDFKGKSKKNGWKITDDDLIAINGQRDQLEGRLQQRYGFANDQARKDVDTWFSSLK
jgi:uncharacterized protein YjbJ (UPF0337 family)